MLKIEFTHIEKDLLITDLLLQSIDLSVYLVDVVIDGLTFRVLENGKSLTRRSHHQILKLFSGHEVRHVFLEHNSAYDEMIGQPARQLANTMKTKIL